MKIKYEFADGTVSEVEVEESIGAVIIEDRRLEDNLSRKERTTVIRWMQRSLWERNMLTGKRRKRRWSVKWKRSISPRHWTGCRKCSAGGF